QNDLESRPAALQFLEQADTVELIHAQVRNHQIRTETQCRGEAQPGALHRLDLLLFGAQANRQQAQQSPILVDDQDAGFPISRLIHFGVPSAGFFRSVRLRSMLAMASSLAWASSSWRRSFAFSSISAC